jgi:hypothetical protein
MGRFLGDASAVTPLDSLARALLLFAQDRLNDDGTPSMLVKHQRSST